MLKRSHSSADKAGCGKLLAALVCAVFMVSCAVERSRATPISAAEQVIQRHVAAYNAHDIEAFMATFADDAVVYRVPNTAPAMTGKQQVREFYRDQRFNLPKLHLEILHRSVIGDKVVDHDASPDCSRNRWRSSRRMSSVMG